MENLYMINIGGSTEKSNIEVHDILFVVAESIEQTYELVKQSWYGTKTSLHIDSYKILREVNGCKIELSEVNNEDNLYMLTYGGHKPGEFSESHRIHFVVSKSTSEAKLQGETDIHNYDYMDHVDEICDIQKVLLGSNKFVSLVKCDTSFDETPDWSGYIKLF